MAPTTVTTEKSGIDAVIEAERALCGAVLAWVGPAEAAAAATIKLQRQQAHVEGAQRELAEAIRAVGLRDRRLGDVLYRLGESVTAETLPSADGFAKRALRAAEGLRAARAAVVTPYEQQQQAVLVRNLRWRDVLLSLDALAAAAPEAVGAPYRHAVEVAHGGDYAGARERFAAWLGELS